ncbi:hypothetical protein K0028_00470 [Curtobacterium flaccumfaciens pv. flaccumfaciens]|uniref:hypothetical protein n=1 Tax=Curtobacterium flaccumfaciens TaxID=2035 RepID=UPI00188C5258|nr:hypothetical protein [Curtobacterium flaccumfaciens]MBF4629381.1 hypothetical protein [Curtobacterium flaccumfaciens]QYI97469.1 hypothetical protein K0028_00470 [Curtobacterium flaccumfaciens pv. flaccumfaciens]
MATTSGEHHPRNGTRRDSRWAVPVRRVFPWWYLGGAVATLAILILVDPGGSQATVAFWGPMIGITIQDRERAARARLDRGLPVDRRSLLSPPWLEPTCAVLLTGVAVGLGMLINALFGHGTSITAWVGAGVFLGSAASFVALVLVLRSRRRRSSGAGGQPDDVS